MTQINNIIKITLLMLCISAINLIAQKDGGEELQDIPYNTIKKEIIVSPENPCCILVNIYSNSYGGFRIVLNQQKGDGSFYNDTLVAIIGGHNYFTLCPSEGDEYIDAVIYIQDENGAPLSGIYTENKTKFTIHEKVNCCECPKNMDEFMKVELIANACENGCEVRHTFDLPDEYKKCFKYVKFKNSKMTNVEFLSIEEANKFIGRFNTCIGNYEKYTVYVSLVKYNGEECKYNKTVYCKGQPLPLKELCVPDCSDDYWNEIKELTVVSDICPGCTINVSYTWRKACEKYQDIQIVKFEVPNDECKDCPPEKLYQMALDEIIRTNEMLFKPRYPGDCDEYWRVAIASCWSTWRYYYEDGPYMRYIDVYELCKMTTCCVQKMRVCLDKAKNYIVTPTDGNIYYNDKCARTIFDDYMNGQSLECYPACHWLGNYKGSTGKAPKKKEKVSFKIDYENAYGLNSGIEDNILKVNIKAPKPGNAEVTVYDVSGKEMIKETAVITDGNINTIMIGIAELQSGNYIYTVTIDGRKLESHKFNINK